MEIQILATLIGTIGVLAGTWLGAYLNRKGSLNVALQLVAVDRHKYTQDRLWDAQKEAYTTIISDLNIMNRLAAKIYDGFYGEYSDGERYFAVGSYSSDSSEIWERFRLLKSHFENSALIVSDSFSLQFYDWERALLCSDEDDVPPQRAQDVRDAMTDHLPKFVELAKNELSIPLKSKG